MTYHAPSRPVRVAGILLGAALTASLLAVPTAALADTDPALTVTGNGVVYNGALGSIASAATLADNGDVVVAFNTRTDGAANARVYLTRSSDEGATWTAPTLLKAPASGNSMNSSLGLTTLSDGTLIVPVTETTVHNAYLDRESDLYVARSTDDGATWTGLTTPVSLSPSRYFVINYGKIVELGDGTLLLPMWGQKDAPVSTDYANLDGDPYESGILRSTDGGATWGDYTAIGSDPLLGARLSGTSVIPPAVSETSIVPLADGRLMAMLRYDTQIGAVIRAFYVSYSSDGGHTWTEPAYTNVAGSAAALDIAPCTSSLTGGRTKLVFGYSIPSRATIQTVVSFDDGVTFSNPTALVLPAGTPTAGDMIYPDFVHLSGNRLLTVFTKNSKLYWNMLQDDSGADCQTQLANADAATATSINLYVERADKSGWAWQYGRRQIPVTSTTTMASLATSIAPLVLCNGTLTLTRNGVTLPTTGTVGAAGLANGDTIVVSGAARAPGAAAIGFVDRDRTPLTRLSGNFDDACNGSLTWDYVSRGLIVHKALAAGQTISSISLRDSNAATRVTGSTVHVYQSGDGYSFTEVTGWTATSSTSGGRGLLTLSGLGVTQPYVKLTTTFTDSSGTFAILDKRADIVVTTTP
jgi:hypothetical protein